MDIGNFACSAIIMVGTYRRLILWFKYSVIYLTASDAISILIIVLYRTGYLRYINAAKIISLPLITALIIILYFLTKDMKSKGVIAAPLFANRTKK